MAKIIAFEEYQEKKKQESFESVLQQEVEELERKLDIPEDEPLLVLTDMNAITLGNYLLDVKEKINGTLKDIDIALNILGIEEGEGLPDEEERDF